MNPAQRRFQTGRLEIRPDEHAAILDGRPLNLTVRELQVLIALAARAEHIVSRDNLYFTVWGRLPRNGDRSLDVYVSRLRSKLGKAVPGREFIHTHNGIGYRFSGDF